METQLLLTHGQFCVLSPSLLQLRVVRRGVVVVLQHGALSFQTAALLKHQSILVEGGAIRTLDVHVAQKPGNQNHAFLVRLHCQIRRRRGGHEAEEEEEGKTHNEASVVSRRTLQLMRLVDAKKSWCEGCGLLVRATASKHQGVFAFHRSESVLQHNTTASPPPPPHLMVPRARK